MVVLDGVARVRIAVGAAEVEEVTVEDREHVLGSPSLVNSEHPTLTLPFTVSLHNEMGGGFDTDHLHLAWPWLCKGTDQ